MNKLFKTVLTLGIRLGITCFAFWWVFRLVDVESLKNALQNADRGWILISVLVFLLIQAGCILRWRLLAPTHPAINWKMLTRSYLVGSFFNTFLPTTIGGDVIRGYDLIKATGEWKQSLASILVDRLLGLVGFLSFALMAWMLYAPAREDPVIRAAFLSFCALVAVTFSVLGSRRVLRTMLTPFSKIGLGQLQSHAGQFQEALRSYFHRPQVLLRAAGTTLVVQILCILLFASVSEALHLGIPITFLALVVPIVMTISQVPVSLNGWGVREWATVYLFGRMGVPAANALALSLVCAVIPLLSGLVGAVLFLAKLRRKQA